MDLTLHPRGRRAAATLRALRLTAPREAGEACAITMQPIAESEPPLADQPTLTCAELPHCGHRFAAMPLLTHFALNDMRCPMCRDGLARPMDATKSFPACAWARALDARYVETDGGEEEAHHNNNNDENTSFFLAHFLQHQAHDADLARGQGDSSLPLMATVHFYRHYAADAADAPLLAVQRAPLIPVAYQRAEEILAGRPRFELGASAARDLVDTLQSMQAHALDVAIGLWSHPHMRLRQVQRSPMLAVPRAPAAFVMRGPQLRAVASPTPTLVYIPNRRALHRLGLRDL